VLHGTPWQTRINQWAVDTCPAALPFSINDKGSASFNLWHPGTIGTTDTCARAGVEYVWLALQAVVLMTGDRGTSRILCENFKISISKFRIRYWLDRDWLDRRTDDRRRCRSWTDDKFLAMC
jgi:hypothetical protein